MSTAAVKSEPRVEVRCPSCRTYMHITVSYQRRCQKAKHLPPCADCRRIGAVSAREDDYWFWLEHFGVARNGLTALQYVAKHGLPDGLAELIGDMRH